MKSIKSGSKAPNSTNDAQNLDARKANNTGVNENSPGFKTRGAKERNGVSQHISPSFEKMKRDDSQGSSLYENVMVAGNVSSNDHLNVKNDSSAITSKLTNISSRKSNDNLHASDNSIAEKKIAITPTKNMSPSYKMVIFIFNFKKKILFLLYFILSSL